MATRNRSLLNVATRIDPAQTTDPVFPASLSQFGSNDVWDHDVLVFGGNNAAQPTVRTGISGRIQVPDDYVGTAQIVFIWTATLTAGDVVWDFDYRTVAGNDANSLDQAGTEEAVTVTDTAPGASLRRMEVAVNLTSANLAAGETLQFNLYRDGADAADTMAGSALLVDALLRYADA